MVALILNGQQNEGRGNTMRSTSVFAISLAIFCLSACSQGDFAAGGAAASKDKSGGGAGTACGAPQCNPDGTPATGMNGTTPGSPSNPSTGTPIASNSDMTISSDGSITINVPLAKIELSVEVDHVTDFIVSDSDMYAVHHEKAIPKFGSFRFFGANGQQLDTQNWTPTWANCPVNPQVDVNCQSSHIILKAGNTMKKIVTKQKGRGRVWKFADTPFTARVTDCGAKDCGSYGATGPTQSSTDNYVWTME